MFDLVEQADRVERLVDGGQFPLFLLTKGTCPEEPLLRRLRPVIHPVHPGPMPRLAHQLEYRLKEVGVEAKQAVDVVEGREGGVGDLAVVPDEPSGGWGDAYRDYAERGPGLFASLILSPSSTAHCSIHPNIPLISSLSNSPSDMPRISRQTNSVCWPRHGAGIRPVAGVFDSFEV